MFFGVALDINNYRGGTIPVWSTMMLLIFRHHLYINNILGQHLSTLVTYDTDVLPASTSTSTRPGAAPPLSGHYGANHPSASSSTSTTHWGQHHSSPLSILWHQCFFWRRLLHRQHAGGGTIAPRCPTAPTSASYSSLTTPGATLHTPGSIRRRRRFSVESSTTTPRAAPPLSGPLRCRWSSGVIFDIDNMGGDITPPMFHAMPKDCRHRLQHRRHRGRHHTSPRSM